MPIRREDLRKYSRPVPPPPRPIEPVLSAVEEAALIASSRRRDDPVVAARRARVLTLLRRPATPEGADAELVALLAAARALPLERDEDRLAARQQLVGIGRVADPPPEVRRLLRKFGVAPGDGPAFAEALLPSRYDGGSPFHEGDFG